MAEAPSISTDPDSPINSQLDDCATSQLYSGRATSLAATATCESILSVSTHPSSPLEGSLALIALVTTYRHRTRRAHPPSSPAQLSGAYGYRSCCEDDESPTDTPMNSLFCTLLQLLLLLPRCYLFTHLGCHSNMANSQTSFLPCIGRSLWSRDQRLGYSLDPGRSAWHS